MTRTRRQPAAVRRCCSTGQEKHEVFRGHRRRLTSPPEPIRPDASQPGTREHPGHPPFSGHGDLGPLSLASGSPSVKWGEPSAPARMVQRQNEITHAKESVPASGRYQKRYGAVYLHSGSVFCVWLCTPLKRGSLCVDLKERHSFVTLEWWSEPANTTTCLASHPL